MYYVWEKALGLDKEFAFFSDPPSGFRARVWNSAEKMAAAPAVELTGDSDSPTTLSDVLLTGFQLQVFSPKLMSLLNDMGIHNVQYLPLSIVNHETKKKETSHGIANIIGAINCADLDNSDYDRDDASGSLLRLSKFRIIPEKIVAPSGMRGAPMLFRLGEFKRHILVHESVKEACQKARISGLKFTPPESYV